MDKGRERTDADQHYLRQIIYTLTLFSIPGSSNIDQTLPEQIKDLKCYTYFYMLAFRLYANSGQILFFCNQPRTKDSRLLGQTDFFLYVLIFLSTSLLFSGVITHVI